MSTSESLSEADRSRSQEESDLQLAIRLSKQLNGSPTRSFVDLTDSPGRDDRDEQMCRDEALARQLQEQEEEDIHQIPAAERASGDPQSKRLKRDSAFAAAGYNDNDDDEHGARRRPRSPLVPLRLLCNPSLPTPFNRDTVSIREIVSGDITFAILMNYMIDPIWLLSACPKLLAVPCVACFHGCDDISQAPPPNFQLYKPPLPIAYGTHHTKMFILVYKTHVRVCVHTANLIYTDWNMKTQAAWYQDFPLKSQAEVATPGSQAGSSRSSGESCGGSEFEEDLLEYMQALRWKGAQWRVGPEEHRFHVADLRRYDYSAAQVRLIASVPGYHSGEQRSQWGHMKLRAVLGEQSFPQRFARTPLLAQFSSLGSTNPKWLHEFTTSLSAGRAASDRDEESSGGAEGPARSPAGEAVGGARCTPSGGSGAALSGAPSGSGSRLGEGELQVIWPTVESVRESLEGYAAGQSVPGPSKNVEKECMQHRWHRWRAERSGRSAAIPHIKTFARYLAHPSTASPHPHQPELAWFLLTSSNLSQAAWGCLQKNNAQLMVRSYEMGVLFLPATMSRSLPPDVSCPTSESRQGHHTSSVPVPSVTLNLYDWTGKADESVEASQTSCKLPSPGKPQSQHVSVFLQVPYDLPPVPYRRGMDVPWAWDRLYDVPDRFGRTSAEGGSFYGRVQD